jgi:hypothetical protein
MDRLKKAALLTRLVEKLRAQGSWCGETHVQKSTLFLQDLMGVPLGFDFILYKHGPFSFDLRDELTALRADELIRLEPQRPYGPQIALTERSKYIQEACSKTLDEYEGHITFVTDKLGNKGVADLERLATALFITLRPEAGRSVNERAGQITLLKPHISDESALIAVREVDGIIEEARELEL